MNNNEEQPEEHKPLPEETDYFYEDVVDLNDKTELQRGFSTEKTLPTISPAILSHYIPGDTPTLYASARPNSSGTIVDDHGSQSNSGSTTAYTFFGVPIPPINLNNIWGQAAKGTGKKLKDGRRNSSAKKPSTADPEGFRPAVTTAPDHAYFAEETENEEEMDTVYRNRSSSNKIVGSGGLPRYHYSTTTESTGLYNRFPGNDFGYSKFVNYTTRDSLFESATMNSVVRSTAKPGPIDNQQQQTVTSDVTLLNDRPVYVQSSEGQPKLSTGNVNFLK